MVGGYWVWLLSLTRTEAADHEKNSAVGGRAATVVP